MPKPATHAPPLFLARTKHTSSSISRSSSNQKPKQIGPLASGRTTAFIFVPPSLTHLHRSHQKQRQVLRCARTYVIQPLWISLSLSLTPRPSLMNKPRSSSRTELKLSLKLVLDRRIASVIKEGVFRTAFRTAIRTCVCEKKKDPAQKNPRNIPIPVTHRNFLPRSRRRRRPA